MIQWVGLMWGWRKSINFTSMPSLFRLLRSSWRKNGNRALVYLRVNANGPCEVAARLGTTDVLALEEIFRTEVYSGLRSTLAEAQYIIDCGANAGYSSVYFLRHSRNARVFAIEPDPDNASVCEANLKALMETGRARLLRGAVWSREEKLLLEGEGEWAFSVKPGNVEGAPVQGYSLEQIVQFSGFPHVDLLKIDIEGAEREVFEAGIPDWLLDRIHVIAIELHGDQCERAMRASLAGRDFTIERTGAYTILKQNRRGEKHVGLGAR